MSFIRVTAPGLVTHKIVVRGLFPANSNNIGDAQYFEKTLPAGLTAVILSSEHELVKVRGVTVLNPSRAEVEVYVEIAANQDIFIESLLNLNNHTLILY